jgi:hypothetical protein
MSVHLPVPKKLFPGITFKELGTFPKILLKIEKN